MLKKTMLTLAVLSLGSVPISQVVVQAETTAHATQTMSQFITFESPEFGVSVKIALSTVTEREEATIEVIRDSHKIEQVVKHLPEELNQEEYDVLAINLVDEAGHKVIDIPAEITVKNTTLRGELERVLYLTPDGEYRTLPYDKQSETVTFKTDKLNNFALVYKKSETTIKKERFDNIVAISESSSSDQDLTNIVAIADETVNKEINTEVTAPVVDLTPPEGKEDKEDKEDEKENKTDEEKEKDEDNGSVNDTSNVTPSDDVNVPDTNVSESEEETSPTVTEQPETSSVPKGFFENLESAIEYAKSELNGDKKDHYYAYIVNHTSNNTLYFGVAFKQVENGSKNDNLIGSVIIAEPLPQFDAEKDEDGDGIPNGKEVEDGTNPFDSLDPQPLENAKAEDNQIPTGYFATMDEAIAFGESQLNGTDKASFQAYTAGTLTDGTQYYGVDFNTADIGTSEESESELTEEKSEPKNDTTIDNEPNTSNIDSELPDNMPENLRSRHEQFLENGFEYRGKEGEEYVYHKDNVLNAFSLPETLETEDKVNSENAPS